MTADIKKINNQGVINFLNKDYEKAKIDYLKVLTIDSNNATTLNNLGLLYLQEEKFKEAEDVFQKAYDQTNNATYALNLGHSLVYQNRYSDAEKYYKISLTIDKENSVTWKSLISLYEFTNQIDKAIEALSTVVSQVSIDVSFKIQLAKNFIQKEWYQDALNVLSLASQQQKMEHEVWYYTAYIHFKNRNFDLARQAIETSIEHHNTWENSLELAGAISMTYNDLQMSLNYWNEVIKNNPKNFNVRINKAVVLLGNEKENEATTELEYVLENDANNLKAIYYLGSIYIQKETTKQKGIDLLSGLSQSKNPFSAKAKKLLTQIK